MEQPIPGLFYDFVLKRLQATKGRWPQVAKDVGISRRTLEKIARRESENPGVLHIERLYRYFTDRRAA